ncbi:hypothetical protein BH11ACT3_BH11ACT3_25340 [soil metagenome]
MSESESSSDRVTDRVSAEMDAAAAGPGRAALIVVGIVFAALYGYALLQAISNLVELPNVYALFGIAGAVPWPLLVLGVAVPPLLFVAAVLLGRRRPLATRALLFAAGLGATNALALSIVTFVGALQPAITQ